MDKEELVRAIMEDVGIDKELAEKVVDSVLNYIRKHAESASGSPESEKPKQAEDGKTSEA